MKGRGEEGGERRGVKGRGGRGEKGRGEKGRGGRGEKGWVTLLPIGTVERQKYSSQPNICARKIIT